MDNGKAKETKETGIVQVAQDVAGQAVSALLQDASFQAAVATSLQAVARQRLVLTVEEIRLEHMRALRATLKTAYRRAAVRAGMIDQ